MKKPELLAPAGDKESLIAAIKAGADAVYLGGKSFGARALSKNFNNEELKEAIDFAHKYQSKVYVTFNTIIYPEETFQAIQFARYLSTIGVDGVLVQDFGLVNIIKSKFPNLPIHASTQMFIHNKDGLSFLKKAGFSRAVLARECSINEIKELINQGIEIEVFVNGALCVSCSGQCYFSLDKGSRSGNRGDCAQPCRLEYSLLEDNKEISLPGKYLLSPKDLYTLDRVYELIELGIDSFKIEGRMKRKEFIYQIVSQYRSAIDSYFNHKIPLINKEDTEKLFNRGFTYGHLFDNRGDKLMNPIRPNHLGVLLGKVRDYKDGWFEIQLENNLHQNDGIRIISTNDYGFNVNWMKKNNQLISSATKGETVWIKSKYKLNKNDTVLLTTDSRLIESIDNKINSHSYHKSIELFVSGKINNPLKFSTTINGNIINLSSNQLLESSKNHPTTKNEIISKLNKTLDTPYIFNPININIDDNLFIPLSLINNMKRDFIKLIESELSKPSYQHIESNITKYPTPIITNDIYVTINNEAQYQAIKDLPIKIFATDINLAIKYHLGYYMNRYNDFNDIDLNTDIFINEPGQLLKLNNKICSMYFNVSNAYALNMLYQYKVSAIELSRELNDSQIKTLINDYQSIYKTNPNLIYYIYGYRELMLTKYCLPNTYLTKDQLPNCGLCKKHNYTLKGQKEYPLLFDNDCFMHILESKPYNRIHDLALLKKMGITNFHLHFYNESPIEVYKLITSIL